MTPANPYRRSVPTGDLARWYEARWAYIMPDFDNSGHSIVEWLSDKAPVEPNRVPEIQTENANERTVHRA